MIDSDSFGENTLSVTKWTGYDIVWLTVLLLILGDRPIICYNHYISYLNWNSNPNWPNNYILVFTRNPRTHNWRGYTTITNKLLLLVGCIQNYYIMCLNSVLKWVSISAEKEQTITGWSSNPNDTCRQPIQIQVSRQSNLKSKRNKVLFG